MPQRSSIIRRETFDRVARLEFVVLVALGIVFSTGCETPPSTVPSQPTVRAAKPPLVVASGDVGGRLEATTCKAERPGGLARRAALLEQLNDGYRTIYVDVGGANQGDGPFDRLLWEAQLRGEVALGVVAHNLGREEAALPAEFRAALTKRVAVPWVSSNVRDAAGAYLAEPIRVVDHDGRTTVVLGILSPDRAPPGVTVDDPFRAIETVLHDYDWQKRRPDALIVLLDADRDEAERLTAQLPAWAIVLRRSEREGLINVDTRPHEARLLDVPARGEGVVVTEWSAGSGLAANDSARPQVSSRVHALTEEAPKIKFASVDAFQRDAARAGFTAFDTTRSLVHAAPLKPHARLEPELMRYAGADACRDCHRQESVICDTGPHARAWQTLIDRGAQHDLRCQQCHTTGFGGATPAAAPHNQAAGPDRETQGGFVSAKTTGQFHAVRCESCHGPSAAHAAEPTLPTPWTAAASCTQCHDPEHSPGFFYDDAWTRIRHGERPAETTDRPKFFDPRSGL